MIRTLVMPTLFAALLMKTTLVCAQEQTPPSTTKGSSAFCLYELPPGEDGKRRWINMGIIQYLEFNRNELRIHYGGGNLGSGHEARLPIANHAHLDDMLEKIRQTAANCR